MTTKLQQGKRYKVALDSISKEVDKLVGFNSAIRLDNERLHSEVNALVNEREILSANIATIEKSNKEYAKSLKRQKMYKKVFKSTALISLGINATIITLYLVFK